jgi:hypothetical protein
MRKYCNAFLAVEVIFLYGDEGEGIAMPLSYLEMCDYNKHSHSSKHICGISEDIWALKK